MRRIAPLFVTAALVLGVAVAVAAPAGATAPAKTSSFCKALKNFRTPTIGEDLSEADAAKAAKQLRKLSRKATGSTKQAIQKIASGLEDVADGGSAKDLLTVDYIKASGTFALASVKCLAGGIELPGLPGS